MGQAWCISALVPELCEVPGRSIRAEEVSSNRGFLSLVVLFRPVSVPGQSRRWQCAIRLRQVETA